MLEIEPQEEQTIKAAYQAAVKVTTYLQPFANPKSREEKYIHPVAGIPGASVTNKKDIIRFSVPMIPPHAIRDQVLHSKMKDNWLGMMKYAYAKAGITQSFEHAMCQIQVHHKLNAPWDVDNRVYKYIIDGLRFLSIIPDDSSKHLSYMITGFPNSTEPRTEILVTDFYRVRKLFQEINYF